MPGQRVLSPSHPVLHVGALRDVQPRACSSEDSARLWVQWAALHRQGGGRRAGWSMGLDGPIQDAGKPLQRLSDQ